MKEENGTMHDVVRAHIYVSGIVQGVFFRAHTTMAARSLGLSGWVKNLIDGRVEIVAEGARQRIGRLISWCQKGPPAAEVEGVEVMYEKPLGDMTEFHTLH